MVIKQWSLLMQFHYLQDSSTNILLNLAASRIQQVMSVSRKTIAVSVFKSCKGTSGLYNTGIIDWWKHWRLVSERSWTFWTRRTNSNQFTGRTETIVSLSKIIKASTFPGPRPRSNYLPHTFQRLHCLLTALASHIITLSHGIPCQA